MKDRLIALALACLLSATFALPAQADGFKFPTIPNPFKKPESAAQSEPDGGPQRTSWNLFDKDERGAGQTTARESRSFSLPKLKLPKFQLPSFGSDRADQTTSAMSSQSSSSRQSTSRSSTSRQSRANHNRPDEPSTLDKIGRGTKNFFDKAKTTLMPWTNDTASTTTQRPPPPSGSGSRHSARTNSVSRTRSRSSSEAREASSESGFKLPWLKPKVEEPPKEIRTASDFLALPRPKY